ncbi:arginine/lysine/ornithine decarboxylase [Chryseomicrobium aureum]|uniref:aminotransferase class I/II-fold pyridoxal phosphate-dependent enzyme n=1 Tax=Chryseomicrobium aureum TaxID=1441723 RepID=UPI0030842DDE|nr:arginine/lysine/ornithine decarboxylase [Chryseomicrobium aureum]
MRRPLVEKLQQFVEKQPMSLHVPGHKNGYFSTLPKALRDSLSYDVTELTGLDDLHAPEGVIQEAQDLLSTFYGSDASYFLVNGSTVGNLAMMLAATTPGDRVLIQRNAHKSVFHAVELARVRPMFITPEWDHRTETAAHVSLQGIQQAFHEFPDIRAVALTTPTYFGVVSDLLEIVEFCHTKGVPVLVDEAHGAHFQGSDYFPVSALECGADVVVQSAHKSLPAMTMGSFLHSKSKFVGKDRLEHALRMLQSSSPSYPVMASLDDARAYLASFTARDYHHFMDKRALFLDSLQGISGLDIVEVDDPLKLMIRIGTHAGHQVRDALEQQGVYVELAHGQHVLWMLPLLKYGEDYRFAELRSRVKRACEALKSVRPQALPVVTAVAANQLTKPEVALEEVQRRNGEWISYTKAIGRIAKGAIIPYPPGIPLLLPGERFTVKTLVQLEECLMGKAAFQGEHRLAQRQVYVLEETN